MTYKVSKASAVMYIITFVLSVFAWTVVQNSGAVEAVTCNPIYINTYGTAGGTGAALSGEIIFNIGIPTSSTIPSRVTVWANSREIGQAKPDANSNYSWTMLIPAKLLPPGEYNFTAKAYFTDNTSCESSPNIKLVAHNEPATFNIVPSTLNINIPVNTNLGISAGIEVAGHTSDYSEFALFEWQVQGRGNVSSTQADKAMFFSGPNVGNGELVIKADYGFHDTQVNIPITVSSTSIPAQSNEAIEDTSDEFEAAEPTEADNQQPRTTQVIRSVENDPLIKNCLEGALGTTAFSQISNGQRRPNATELNDARACFARTAYILPSNFAPVAPNEIEKLLNSDRVQIVNLIASELQRNDATVKSLRFEGTAEPNSNVYLYIFSEPLVLTVTAGTSGEWVYELENPLEPGEHTAYAVVDRGDGVYERTSPFDFIIGQAEATSANPEGLSLELESSSRATATQSNRSTVVYVASAVVLLLLSSLAVMLRLKQHKKSLALAGSTSTEAASSIPEPQQSSDKDTASTEQEHEQT